MPNRYYTRRFLNRRGYHAGGYVLASVEDTSRRHDANPWSDVTFTVADCGRQIDLSFSAHPEDLANSLYKIDLLIDTLTRFRSALVEEGPLAADRARTKQTAKAAPRASAS